jgi:hypothetical protein
MQRLPSGRHSAVRPNRSPDRTRSRGNSTAARFRWILVLGVLSALLGVGLTIGLSRKPALLPASADPASHLTNSRLLGPSVQSHFGRAHIRRRHSAPEPGRHARRLKPTHAASATPTATPAPTPTPVPTRTTAPTPTPTETGALTPAATQENQTPRGDNELAWSEAILRALGDPLTDANIISLGYWMQNEAGSPPSGIVGANNPINVSQPGYGGWPIKSEGGGWSLYSYPTPQDGIAATAKYLTPTSYPDILAALKAGVGLSSSSLASELSTYSGGGYSTIPDAWGLSQGKPKT